MAMQRRKIFQIGFNRCGTRAIASFFEQHGYKAAHWEFGQIARDLEGDIAAGRPPLSGWADVDVFTDMEMVSEAELIEGFRRFRELHAAYPDALFILNTRSVEEWLRSRIQHADGFYVAAYQEHLGLKNKQQVIDAWRRDWFSHHLDVVDYFTGPRRGNLYAWDLGKPNFHALTVRLGHPLDQTAWTKVGSKKDDASILKMG